MGTHALGNQVVWFDIPCRDLDRGIAFYSALLNCQVEKQGDGDAAVGVLPHDETTVGGCLVNAVSENPPSDNGVLVYLNCQDRLDDAVTAATSNGGQVLQEKHSIGPHGWRAIIRDSEGNQVALHSM